MINKRFFNFKKYNTFLQNKSVIPNDAIVFIQDRRSIWTHGNEYMCDVSGDSMINQNSLEFKDSAGNIIFKISIDNDEIVLTDSSGNTVTKLYVLKSEFDEYKASKEPLFELIQSLGTTVSTLLNNQTLDAASLRRWVNNKFDDMLGINADAISELKAILSDDDTTTGILREISKKADKTSIPTKVSQLTNDSGYLTLHLDISGKANTVDVQNTFNQLRNLILNSSNTKDLSKMAEAISGILDLIQHEIDDKYVLKVDVYNTEYNDWSDKDISIISADQLLGTLNG